MGQDNWAAIIGIVLGGLVCLFGYRLMRVTIGIAGFCVGAVLGGGLVDTIPNVSRVLVLVAALVAGVVGAILAAVLYKVGVFILGAGGGALAVGLVLTSFGVVATPLILIGAGIVSGILALLLQRVAVSVLTAFAGAWPVVAGTFHLLGCYEFRAGILRPGTALKSAGSSVYLMLLMWLGLGILGSMVQLSRSKKKK